MEEKDNKPIKDSLSNLTSAKKSVSYLSLKDSNPIVGNLSDDEKSLVVARYKRNITSLYILIVICLLLITLIFPIIIAIILFTYINKKKVIIETIKNDKVPIARVSGIMAIRSVRMGNWFSSSRYSIVIGDFAMPEYCSYPDPLANLVFKDSPYIGEIMTVEYLPSLNLNRCYYDKSGHGYNSLTKKVI
jgi:hypothetical protein